MSTFLRGGRLALTLALAVLAPLAACLAAPTKTVWLLQPSVQRSGQSLVVNVQGSAPKGAWLGCSFYPPGTRNIATQGVHQVVPVTNTTYTQRFAVPQNCVGGTYEVALWGARVPASECKIPNDPWCKRNGFHLSGMLALRRGSFR